MKVIFFDIDGVLNSSKTVDRNFDYPELDPRNLAVLQEIVSKTDAVLVLISSWKDDWLNEEGTASRSQEIYAITERYMTHTVVRIMTLCCVTILYFPVKA